MAKFIDFRRLAWVVIILGLTSSVGSAMSDQATTDFAENLKTLASFGDRSTGTPGNESAAAFIKDSFTRLGFETVDSMKFSVPVMRYGESTLTLPQHGLSTTIRPIKSNAITPQTIPPPGIKAPLVYVGSGKLQEFNDKVIEGAIVLMDLESAKHWLYAANLGAKALIYVDRGQSPKIFFEEKFELSPMHFPRFWMSLEQVRTLFPDFSTNTTGRISDQVQLAAQAEWQLSTTENIYCIVPGSDPELREQMVMVEAFFDSTAWVPGFSPGADEACGITTLLYLARRLKESPPLRTVLLVASNAHDQALAGMRELVWSFTTRTLIQRKMQMDLKRLIVNTRQTITALQNMTFVTATDPGSSDSANQGLAKTALEERIKTVADKVSRRLMRLRLQAGEGEQQQQQIEKLAAERQLLRRLMWKTEYTDSSLEERRALEELIPQTLEDQQAILTDAENQLHLLESARDFRGQAKMYDLATSVSLHLSSKGDGFGAFNYGWQYPFRPRIKRTAAYSKLDDVLRQGAAQVQETLGIGEMYKDTLRPSRRRSWQSYFLDFPPLGGEIMALAGYHGLTFVTTHDARSVWGTPSDIPENVDLAFATRQADLVAGLIQHLAAAPIIHENIMPRNGFGEINGNAKFLRHGELFADKPAPGTVLLGYQGPGRFYAIVDHMGKFHLRGVADKKHSYHKVIFEGYKFDEASGDVVWAIDKKQTGKPSYRTKMYRRHMETDLVMFACSGSTIFNLVEPRTFLYFHKGKIIDGRREADPLRYWFSRWDTWITSYKNASSITTLFLDPGTPFKLTLSDSPLRKKFILLNASQKNPEGKGYLIDDWPFIHRTEYRVAHDMWMLLGPRISNLEKRGIFNERIRKLQTDGVQALKGAEEALQTKRYDRFFESSIRSWALASRVYDDVEKTQKDVLYGVLFYIALFVPFAFCMERLLFSFANIYKRILAFCGILILLILVIYNVHPAFRLAYSPMVVILAFLIMGLSLVVTLIIFFRFEEEMTQLQTRAKIVQSGEIGRWKAFVAAFLLGVSNLRRRRLRTALTCITLIILTFTIMSFTSAKSMRRHARILYDDRTAYQGLLLKNVNWRDLPANAFGYIANSFSQRGVAAPRVWLEDEDKTRSTRIPIYRKGDSIQAQGLVGLSHLESQVTGLNEILLGGRWLTEGERQAVLLPDRLAEALDIDPTQPEQAVVDIWGMPFRVVGVFSGEKLQNRADLDGEPLTPVIFPHEVSGEMTAEEEEAFESGDDVREFQSRYQHVDADLTIIIPYQTLLAAGGHLKGVAIRPDPDMSVTELAQDLVDRYGLSLFSGEPDGTYLYHASDTMSYSGVPNILIPLIISIFIVLNTMIGSVYERKREIGIYTSVGLAPSHVSFLFIAESLAFAVISVVLGYLLAQSTAKLFAETALWSGITVNYSSLAGVAAMILVILVVLISVIYPSKVAGEIAIPDVNRSWSLPSVRGNTLELRLPFLMRYREHRSIGGTLYEYFQGHQDVSHGSFSTGNIEFRFACQTPPGLAEEESNCPEAECEYDSCLHLRSSVWLAPFDFGIMQQVDLEFVPAATEAGYLEIHVRLVRLTGEANAWYRINKGFLHHIRKQLLMWRSFDEQTKYHYENLLAQAEKELIDQAEQVAE